MSETQYFRNLAIDPNDLPAVEDIDYTLVEARSVRIIYWNTLIIFSLAAVPIYFIGREEGFSSTVCIVYIVVWWLIFGFFMLTARIFVRRRKYAVREKDIHYQRGWLWQKHTSIPFHRIQHAEINRGIFSRALRLSELKVYTAGGATSDLAIPGLPEDVAQNLKAFIIRKTELRLDEEE